MDELTADEMEWMAMEDERPSPKGWEPDSAEEEGPEVSENCGLRQPEVVILAKGTSHFLREQCQFLQLLRS